jgi:uncharacterized membrane protein YdjX (TVP38/TMEM64 family)
MNRLWLLALALSVAILLPFVIWGGQLETAFDLQRSRAWLLEWGSAGWIAGVLLIVADILLPIPATVVMSALGLAYGWFWGGLAASLGTFLAGMFGYGLCRMWGRGVAHWIAGTEGLATAERLFARHGSWLVAFSRWMPVLPEAIASMAGLVRMPLRKYCLSLTAGALPVGFAFAAVGHLGQEHEAAALVLSATLPIVLWTLAAWMRR